MQQSLKGPYSVRELAQQVGGEVVGDADYMIFGLASLSQAESHQLSLVARSKMRTEGARSRAGALLVSPELADGMSAHCIVVTDPYLAYATLSQLFWCRQMLPDGVAPSAIVSADVEVPASCRLGPHVVVESGVQLGENVEVGAGCYLGEGVHVGTNTHLRPRVTLYPGTQIGSDCLVHAGAVLGSDGFGFAPKAPGWEKIAQLGRVIVGDRVEIGANAAIDRGALEDTVIGDDVIIDNLVHIAHNVVIGDGCALAGQVGIAGSAKLGKQVLAGGQVGIGGHITIADGVQFHGQAMVTKSISESGGYASGIPAQPVNDWRKMVARLRQVTELSSKVTTLWHAHLAGAAKAETDGGAGTRNASEQDTDTQQTKDQ